MTTTHTDTLPLAARTSPIAHEHAWVTDSAHATSIGMLSYVRCVSCSARRVDLAPRSVLPPMASSHIVASPVTAAGA